MIADFTNTTNINMININLNMMALIRMMIDAHPDEGQEKPCGEQARKTEHL